MFRIKAAEIPSWLCPALWFHSKERARIILLLESSQIFLVKGIEKLGDYFDAKTRLIGLKREFLCAEARLLIEKRKRNNQHLSLITRLRENQTNEAGNQVKIVITWGWIVITLGRPLSSELYINAGGTFHVEMPSFVFLVKVIICPLQLIITGWNFNKNGRPKPCIIGFVGLNYLTGLAHTNISSYKDGKKLNQNNRPITCGIMTVTSLVYLWRMSQKNE